MRLQIPCSWKYEKLGDLVQIQSGESPSKYNVSKTGKYPFVKVEDLNNCSKYQTESRLYTDDEKVFIKIGSIIFPKRGAAILNNKVRIVDKSLYIDSNLMALTVKSDNLKSEFLYYTLVYQKLFKIADTSTIPQINNKHINPYKIPLPSLLEQEKIAEILGTWDKAIELTEKLIQAKTQLKKGLMQQLLTGKRRFGEFGKETWLCKKLQEVCKKFVNGGTPSTENKEYWEGDIPWITGADIEYQKVKLIRRKITKEAVSESSTNVIEKGNLLIVTRTGVGKILIAPYDIAISQDFTGVYPDNKILFNLYLFYFMDFSIKKLARLNQGTSINGILRKDLLKHEIQIPTIIEQQKIAAVLSACDKEIDLLTQKLNALKTQKKGLMQKLLTGQVRVNHMI